MKLKLGLFMTSSLLFITAHSSAHEIITQVSMNVAHIGGNGNSLAPSLSGDGRYLVFQSDANNLIPNDTNGYTDIFLYDRVTTQLQRISVNSQSEEANFISIFASLSDDGRYVAFQSDAVNLSRGDNNYTTDIFLRDQQTQQTALISVNSQGEQGNSTSSEPAISADGRYIAFHSYASNLVTDDTNGKSDVFLYDRKTQETTRISVGAKGKQARGPSFGAAISATGRYIAFSSEADNLVKGDTNQFVDVFIHDREKGETTRVSVSSQSEESNQASFNPTISADGRYIAFQSRASNLVLEDTNNVEDIFLHDQQTGSTTRISINSERQQGEQASFMPQLSANGHYLVFNSNADNLVADDDNGGTDVFIANLANGQIRRLTINGQHGENPRASLYSPAISNDGRWAAFESQAWNLVANDFNEASDIFLYDRDYSATYEVANGLLYIPVLAAVPDLGLFKVYLHLAADKVPLQFTLDKIRPFYISLAMEDITTAYDVQTGSLQLPRIEIVNPPQNSQYCQVQMLADSQLTVFTVKQVNCTSP